MGNKRKRLTPKQARFAEEYLIDGNATQAALRAGYSERSAYSQGQRLLKKDEVQECIRKGQERIQRRLEVTQERIVKELARLAFCDPRDFFTEHGALKPIHELSDDAAAVIAGMDVSKGLNGEILRKIKLNRKEKALEMLCKHLGLFDEKMTIGFSSEVLNAILSALPDEFAESVREALGELVSSK